LKLYSSFKYITGGQDNKLRIWDIKTARLLRTLGPFTNPVKSVAYGETWRVASEFRNAASNSNAPADVDASSSAGSADKDAKFAYQPGIWIAVEDNLEFYSLGLYK
jgi:WD40 repeat protein